MQIEPFLLLTAAFGFMLFLVQRTERRRRLTVFIIMALLGVIIVRYISFREYQTEGIAAFAIALILNFLFWLLIGHYNPVKSSDNIKVLGMDD